MAEEVLTNRDVPSGSRETCLTECPLCVQTLRCPRSLPCFHSFCEECLKTSIQSQSQEPNEEPSFICPMCRVVTLPVDPQQKREEWVTQFTANTLTIELTTQNDAGCKLYNCYPCSKKGRNDSVAIVWWKEANKYLCDSCKDNDMISDEDTLLSIDGDFRSTTSLCSQHAADVDMICDDHHSLCCPKCIAIDHRRCDVIHNYADFVKNLRTTSQMEGMRKKLQDAIDAMTVLVQDVNDHSEKLLKDRDSFVDDVKEVRGKIERQLDQLQKMLSDEVHSKFNDEKKELDALVRKCELMKRCIITTKCLTETEHIQTNDMHMVRTFQRGEMEIEAGRKLLQEIAEPYLTRGMTHKILKKAESNEDDDDGRRSDSDDENTEKIDETSLLTTVLSLGRLEMTSQARDFPVCASALLPMSLSPAHEVRELETRTPSDSKDCQITGLVYLQDGRVLVSDYPNEKLKMFSTDGNLLDELQIPYCRGICMKDSETVAVTRLDEGAITHVRIKMRKLEPQSDADIWIGSKCDAIASGDNCYVVGTGQYSASFEISKIVGDCRRDVEWTSRWPQGVAYDAHSKSTLYTAFTTTAREPAVMRLNPPRNRKVVVAEVNNLLTGATGMDVDRDGNIYVCCTESEKIVQISKQGKMRSLVDISDPYRISVCGKTFAVSKGTQSTVKVFQIC